MVLVKKNCLDEHRAEVVEGGDLREVNVALDWVHEAECQLIVRELSDVKMLIYVETNTAQMMHEGEWVELVQVLTKILQWVAFKRGKELLFIDRWERTTGKCSSCAHEQKLHLKDRVFECNSCGLVLDRDHNAAINILEAGHRLILSQLVEDSHLESIQR